MAEEKFTAKQIKLAIMDLKVKKEKHEIAGVMVWVHGLTSYQLEEWRILRNNPSQGVDARLATAKLLQLALHDENGVAIFQANEIAILAGKPSFDVEPVARIILRLSGYGVEAEEAILKNLLRIPGGDGSLEQPESTKQASPGS